MRTRAGSKVSKLFIISLIGFLFISLFVLLNPVTIETTTLYDQSEFLAENQRQQVHYGSLLNMLGPNSLQGISYKHCQCWYRYRKYKLIANHNYNEYRGFFILRKGNLFKTNGSSQRCVLSMM